jgi:hypothetical protein
MLFKSVQAGRRCVEVEVVGVNSVSGDGRQCKHRLALRYRPIRKAPNLSSSLPPTPCKQQASEGKIAMMSNYQNFDEVFSFDPECSYDDDTVAEIERNRKQLEGLFIEKVMKLLGIKRRE